MQIRGGKPPRSGRLARVGMELSREARVRLDWMDFYRHSGNVRRTCRRLGISRETSHQRIPFPIRAVQVDGGSDFAADF